jgi:Ca2+-binding EF-hand superfamily protein
MSGNPDLVEIVHGIRQQFAQNSSKLATLTEAFRVNDKTGTGNFNFEDFEEILGKAGIFCRRQDLTRLYRHFDKDQKEEVAASEVLAALRGEVNARREAIIQAAWANLGGGDSMPITAVFDGFNADGHPDVETGAKTAEKIQGELRRSVAYSGITDTITWDQFHDLYSGISAGQYYDDDWFCAIVSGTYGVKEAQSGEGQAGYLLKIESVLWEKARQCTKQVSLESETIRLAFQKLDLEDSGTVDLNKFNKGLERFGITVRPEISQALFEKHAEGGVVNIASFAKNVCATAAP